LVIGFLAADVNKSNPESVNATETGTWTVQPGNTPNTTAWLTNQLPVTAAAPALTNTSLGAVSASVNVKASAGNVYGVVAQNNATTGCWLQFINSASAGTLGTGIVFQVPIPAAVASAQQPFIYIQAPPYALGSFSSGIAVGLSTSVGGSIACTSANVSVFYK
jgi:hypothetical protein